MAYGSLMEVSSQFEIAEELGYINNADRKNMDVLIDEVARLISGLQKSFKNE
jgi:four helix bundle protein